MINSQPVTVGIGMTLHLATDPTYPDAKRGAVISGHTPQETREQLDAGLVWADCIFCRSYVLVDSTRRTRERCSCGARRCHHTSRDGYYEEGWTREGETWWFC